MLDGMQQVLLDQIDDAGSGVLNRQPEEVGNLDADRFTCRLEVEIEVPPADPRLAGPGCYNMSRPSKCLSV
jgi:hypothetical protein